MVEKFYYEYVVDEIIEMIKTNLLLYYRNRDNTFEDVRKYCNKREDKVYKKLDQWTLSYFTTSALFELLNYYLYDFRSLE